MLVDKKIIGQEMGTLNFGFSKKKQTSKSPTFKTAGRGLRKILRKTENLFF